MADLAISVTNTMAATGNVGGYLRFVNTSAHPCTLRGAPVMQAVTASGGSIQATVSAGVFTPFPSLVAPPLVVLAPGDQAFAAYGGSDIPGTAEATCPPSFHTFNVAPPGETTGVELPAFNAWLNQYQPSCAGLRVTVIAAAEVVEQYADLSSLRP